MSVRKIDAYALLRVLRENEPMVSDDDNGYDQGAHDMWKLLYAAVKAAPTLDKKEDQYGQCLSAKEARGGSILPEPG